MRSLWFLGGRREKYTPHVVSYEVHGDGKGRRMSSVHRMHVRPVPRRGSFPRLRSAGVRHFGSHPPNKRNWCYWETAAGDFQKLLALGDPPSEIVPKLITCLLSAHEEPLSGALAAELRTQHAAQLAPPQKPWWKVW